MVVYKKFTRSHTGPKFMGAKSSKTNREPGTQPSGGDYILSKEPAAATLAWYKGNYELVPTAAKFDKIDLVKYGDVFDGYKASQTAKDIDLRLETFVKQSVHPSADIYNSSSFVEKLRHSKNYDQVINQFRQELFPLHSLMRFAVMYNQCELLEFICTQELMDCHHWPRIYFLANLIHCILLASKSSKLSSVKVMASYCIPERVSRVDFEGLVQGAFSTGGAFYRSAFENQFNVFCLSMIDEGMNGRARRIIETKQALTAHVDETFPKELIGIVVSFAFGLSHQSNAQ